MAFEAAESPLPTKRLGLNFGNLRCRGDHPALRVRLWVRPVTVLARLAIFSHEYEEKDQID
jgi:hypothetical protein